LQDMMYTALLRNGASAIRYPRGTGPGAEIKADPVALEIGRAEVLAEGEEVAIFALGQMVAEGERLRKLLAGEGVSAALINARFAKPVDHDAIARFGKSCGLIVTMEDHVLAGGFGSAVMESLNEQGLDVPVVRVGWPDQFIEHGKVEDLRAKYGLTAEAALERVKPMLRVAASSR
jgi:1-deoxy-D-xylulose-5-phosphate synthase